ncbi:glycosyltransferase [Gammaproteobacteria bacterium]|nr:glycosyltransferase [Gammaproteobacteria bacterium]
MNYFLDITICISTYNNAKYIEKTLSPLLAHLSDKMLIIISDDNSSDGTKEIISKCISTVDKRFVKFLNNNENIGGCGNFLRFLDEVETKYVLFFDGDDILETDAIGVLRDYLEKSSAIAVSSYMLFAETEGKVLRARKISFLNFCLGRRFPLTGTLIRLDFALLDVWRATLPCGPRNQGDLTLCLSLLARGGIVQLPLFGLRYNKRNELGESNYNSITSKSEKMRDKLDLINTNFCWYWRKPSFYLLYGWLILKILKNLYSGRMISNAS